jgi:uncharacterized membrane protein
VTASEFYLIALRLAHAVAALIWLGGGVYYLIALRPAIRASDEPPGAFVAAVHENFREWAQIATWAMLGTGAVLMFERLANQNDGLIYVAVLAAKIFAAVVAFWMAGLRPPRRRRTQRPPARRARPEMIVALGMFAFVAGVALSSLFGGDA